MYYNWVLPLCQPKALQGPGLSVLSFVCDHSEHIRRHFPKSADCLNCDVLDSDLSHNTSDIATQLGAIEVDIVPDAERTDALTAQSSTGKLHSVDNRSQLIVSEVACEDLCVMFVFVGGSNLGDHKI